MGKANIRISAELLRDLLELPKDCKLLGDETGNVLLVVEGERVPKGYEEVLPSWRILTMDEARQPTKTEFIGFNPVGERRGEEDRESTPAADQESTT